MSDGASDWGSRWLRFWFEPAAASRLGIARAVFFAGLLLATSGYDPARWAEVSMAFRVTAGVPALPVLSEGLLAALGVIWRLALAASCLGWRTRTSTTVSFVLGFYLLGLPQTFGKITHAEGPAVLVLGVLAFSRAGDAFSVDRWLQRPGCPAPPISGPEYRWPIRLSQLVLALMLFGAGVSKLSKVGLRWAFSDNFRNLLILHHYTEARAWTDWGLELSRTPILPEAVALAVLVVEAGALAALATRRLRRAWAVAIAAMLLSFPLFLGFAGWALLPCLAFWVPWRSSDPPADS